MYSFRTLPYFFNAPVLGKRLFQKLESATSLKPSSPLRVGVLVGLKHTMTAGGHVKCWERFAEAAVQIPQYIDLSIHFLGEEDKSIPLSPNVRYIHHRPVFSTQCLPFLGEGPGHTDLFPIHFGLQSCLKNYDVIHCTDIFSFGQTALKFCRKNRIPLVKSIHTNVVEFTRVYSKLAMANLTGKWVQENVLSAWFGLEKKFANNIEKKLNRFVRECDGVVVSNDDDWKRVQTLKTPSKIHYLRRGIDKDRFNPKNRNVPALAKYNIPQDKLLLLFVGRVDDSKGVMILGQAAKKLLNKGCAIHVVVAGQGSRSGDLKHLLGENVSLLGSIQQSRLGELYASCDLFVFPSRSEVSPNAVLEACASGLPVMVSAHDGGAQFVKQEGKDGFLIDNDHPQTWATAIEPLIENPVRLKEVGKKASKEIHQNSPSWEEVLKSDLLPVWQTAASGNMEPCEVLPHVASIFYCL